MDTIGNDAIKAAALASPLSAKYSVTIDRESAYEKLTASLAPAGDAADFPSVNANYSPPPTPDLPPAREGSDAGEMVGKVLGSSAMKSFLRSAATVAGREISRSLFSTAKRRR